MSEGFDDAGDDAGDTGEVDRGAGPGRDGPPAGTGEDPVLARRARIGRWVGMGQRIGYGLFIVASVAFVAGFIAGFRPWVVTLIIAAIAVGSAALAPSIVFAYGIKAADRADREGTWDQ